MRRMTFIVKDTPEYDEETDGTDSSTSDEEDEGSGSVIVRDDVDSDEEEGATAQRRKREMEAGADLRASSTPELDVELRRRPARQGGVEHESEDEAKKSESDDEGRENESDSGDDSEVYYLSEEEDEVEREGSTIIREDSDFVPFLPRSSNSDSPDAPPDEEGDDDEESSGSVIVRDDDVAERSAKECDGAQREAVNEITRDEEQQTGTTSPWAQKSARRLNKQVWLKEQRKKRTVKSVLFEEEDFLWATLNNFKAEKQEVDKRRRERRDKRKGVVWASAPIPTRSEPASPLLGLSSSPTLIRGSSSVPSSPLQRSEAIYEPLLVVEFPANVQPGDEPLGDEPGAASSCDSFESSTIDEELTIRNCTVQGGCSEATGCTDPLAGALHIPHTSLATSSRRRPPTPPCAPKPLREEHPRQAPLSPLSSMSPRPHSPRPPSEPSSSPPIRIPFFPMFNIH